MRRTYFERIERASNNTSLKLSEVIDQLAFNEQGLIPNVVQAKRVRRFRLTQNYEHPPQYCVRLTSLVPLAIPGVPIAFI